MSRSLGFERLAYMDVTRRGLVGTGLATACMPLLARPVFSQDKPARVEADQEVVLRHAWGEAVLPRPARRIVSLGYTTQDTVLALGLMPVAIRYWFGDMPFGVWPWAEDAMATATPGAREPAMLVGEVSAERVAALEPDLIVGIGSGISQAEYAVLSRIAPVLMHGAEHDTYGMPWDAMTRVIGRAVGRPREAEALVASVRGAFRAAAARNPGWADATGVAAYHWGGETGAFTNRDHRAAFLAELGFRPTDAVADLARPEGFYAPLSPEDLSPLDADVLLWINSFEETPDLVALPMRRTLDAHREGREVFAGGLVAAALSFGSVLSLPFALEALEADIARAVDGDPDTQVRSAVAAGLVP